MTYSEFEAVVASVLPDATFHLSAPDSLERYVIWMETGSQSAFADDEPYVTCLMASVYIYTQIEGDKLLEQMVNALEAADIVVDGPIPAYDDDQLTMGWVLECEVL
ncbi:MAG: hypothetical protein RSG55_06995 [Oscillospiraceae bacterium]